MNAYFTYKPLEEDRSLGKINGKDLIIPAHSNLIHFHLDSIPESCVQIYYKRTEPEEPFNQKEGLGEQYFPKKYASQLENLLEHFGRRVYPPEIKKQKTA